MLTLRRRPGQSIVVSPPFFGPVRVTVIEMDREGRIVIGVEADRRTPVDRAEVHAAKQRESKEAG